MSLLNKWRDGCVDSLRLCCFTHCKISYRTSPVEHRRQHENTKVKRVSELPSGTHRPELGQRRLKSSLVSRHRALPFISKCPFSGRHSEYSFWAQWSQWATSALSHRDGFIPRKEDAGDLKSQIKGSFKRGTYFVRRGTWLHTACINQDRGEGDSRSRPGRCHRSSWVGGLTTGSRSGLECCTIRGMWFSCIIDIELCALASCCKQKKSYLCRHHTSTRVINAETAKKKIFK